MIVRLAIHGDAYVDSGRWRATEHALPRRRDWRRCRTGFRRPWLAVGTGTPGTRRRTAVLALSPGDSDPGDRARGRRMLRSPGERGRVPAAAHAPRSEPYNYELLPENLRAAIYCIRAGISATDGTRTAANKAVNRCRSPQARRSNMKTWVSRSTTPSAATAPGRVSRDGQNPVVSEQRPAICPRARIAPSLSSCDPAGRARRGPDRPDGVVHGFPGAAAAVARPGNPGRGMDAGGVNDRGKRRRVRCIRRSAAATRAKPPRADRRASEVNAHELLRSHVAEGTRVGVIRKPSVPGR